MSNRSTYSTGSGVSSLYSASGYYPRNNRLQTNGLGDPAQVTKEAEVDKLTDLLVQSMENSNDPDFFGKQRRDESERERASETRSLASFRMRRLAKKDWPY